MGPSPGRPSPSLSIPLNAAAERCGFAPCAIAPVQPAHAFLTRARIGSSLRLLTSVTLEGSSRFRALIHNDIACSAIAPYTKQRAFVALIRREFRGVTCVLDWLSIDLLDHIARF